MNRACICNLLHGLNVPPHVFPSPSYNMHEQLLRPCVPFIPIHSKRRSLHSFRKVQFRTSFSKVAFEQNCCDFVNAMCLGFEMYSIVWSAPVFRMLSCIVGELYVDMWTQSCLFWYQWLRAEFRHMEHVGSECVNFDYVIHQHVYCSCVLYSLAEWVFRPLSVLDNHFMYWLSKTDSIHNWRAKLFRKDTNQTWKSE